MRFGDKAIESSMMIERAVAGRALRSKLGANAIAAVVGRSWEKVADVGMD
jgi:hypothetical protein